MKVLVVDNQPGVALMAVHLFTMAGCLTDAALNGKRALRLAQETDFDLITLDIDLPGTNGFEIYRCIRQIPRHKNVPVIFLSSRNTEEERNRAIALGAMDCIKKPFNPQSFVTQILSVMTSRHDMVE